jgi:hypothetical protein
LLRFDAGTVPNTSSSVEGGTALAAETSSTTASLTVVECKSEGERMEMDEERCTVDAAELSGAAVHAVAVGTANERRAAAAAEIFIDCCCYQIIIDKFMAKVDMPACSS